MFVALLLGKRGDIVKITKNVVEPTACNPDGAYILQLLLWRDPMVKIAQKHSQQPRVVQKAYNPGSKGALEFLLQRNSTLQFIPEIARVAACNICGREVVLWLLILEPNSSISKHRVQTVLD